VSADLAAVAKHIVAALQQRAERLRASKRDLSMAGEEVEEPLLFGHQGTEPAQHECLARNPCKSGQVRTISRSDTGNRAPLERRHLLRKSRISGSVVAVTAAVFSLHGPLIARIVDGKRQARIEECCKRSRRQELGICARERARICAGTRAGSIR
jgi:hypothetical protein